MNKLYHILLTLLMLGATTATFAQVTSATVTGRVTDAKGGNLPGVTIAIVNASTGSRYSAQTNADGRYTMPNVNPGGPYVLSATYIGFKKEERTDINLSLGNATYNFILSDATTELKAVTVRGTGGASKTGSSTRVSAAQLKTLPSISRSLQDFTRTTPQSSNNSFLGTNFRYNNVTLDGAINNDAIGFSPSLGGQGGTSGQPGSSTRTNPVSIDAIQDIQVYLAPYDVKIGNFLGGSINAVTRSGTNTVSGSVYGFGRNASITGRNKAGDNAKLPSSFHEYQTGFRLGFPIIKDKLFFFTNEEITRRQDPVILAAGSADMKIINLAQAQQIQQYVSQKYGVKPDDNSYENYKIYSKSNKYFNRLDWNINDKNQLSIRNNTITSNATNLERDQQNFRFGSIDYKQINNQNSTVAELKSRFGGGLSNSLIVGYSNIHDYRQPTSNPALPQIEIASNGGTIFLGTDREASIFDMKQKTFEFTDNFTMVKNNHTFTFGTHNEFYNITYGFVNGWNGRVAYSNVADFLANAPSRVRTNYNYTDNTRDNIIANPPAQFKVNMFSLYGQDEIQIGDNFKLTPGIRFDLADMPNKQPLSVKTTNAPVDPRYGTTYTYTKPNEIKNSFLGQVQISPRLGFNYDVNGDQTVIVRGGTGIFTGRIPFAWLGYAYYNNGNTFGAFDKRYNYDPAKGAVVTPVAGTDPIKDALTGTGEAGYVKNQGVNVNNAAGATQVDLIDNNFKMPQAWRSSLAVDYKTDNQWRFTLEGIYTKVIHDLQFKQVNLVDNVIYYPYDVNHQQPIYRSVPVTPATTPATTTQAINPLYTNAYLLTNTNQGYRYSLTAQAAKSFPMGLDVSAAYTYGRSKDITNGIRNSMESNWQLNQALNPNNPGLAYSNFDIRSRIVVTGNYRLNWNRANKFISNFSLFFNAQSGTPYSLGFVNTTIDGTGQTVSLVYVPKVGETQSFFAATPTGVTQAAAFDSYINSNKYLSSRRGNFTERNGARTPWNYQGDFRFSQDLNLMRNGKRTHTITFTYDIINLTNLLNKKWGVQYFAPNTFNSTSSVGLTAGTAGTATANPIYTFDQKNVTNYSIDFFSSRWQMQFGLRYSF